MVKFYPKIKCALTGIAVFCTFTFFVTVLKWTGKHSFSFKTMRGMEEKKLLTLFTSFELTDKKPYHAFAHKKAIKNWSEFVPTIQPVLFHNGSNHSLVTQASQANWDLIKLTSFNKFGTPKLKPMFAKVFQTYNSTFYGYANGDILFTDNLIETLQVIEKMLPRLNQSVLIIGRRLNFNINLTLPEEAYDKGNIHNLARKARLFSSDAIDYFIFSSQNLLNWTSLADVVLGRPAYDNYIVSMAIKSGLFVIDATGTVTALHLSTPNVIYEGAKHADGDYNKKVIGKFNYNSGLTVSAKLRTLFDIVHNIFVVFR